MPEPRTVLVCQYTNCQANGSTAVLEAFLAHSVEAVEVAGSGCQGQCNLGPTVRVLPDETWYCRVKPDDVPEIVHSHLQQGTPVDRLLHPRFHPTFWPS
jgi:(2Fe-2S) ferredoxin